MTSVIQQRYETFQTCLRRAETSLTLKALCQKTDVKFQLFLLLNEQWSQLQQAYMALTQAEDKRQCCVLEPKTLDRYQRVEAAMRARLMHVGKTPIPYHRSV